MWLQEIISTSQFPHLSSVQSLSHVWLFATSWIAAHQASLYFTILKSLLRFMCIESMMPSNHLILCHSLLPSPHPQSSVFSSIRGFSNELTLCIRWPKYWNFSFNISSFNEYPGKISFRIAWIDIALNQQGCHRLNSTINQHDLVIIYRISH